MKPSPPDESSTFRWSIKWKLMAMITVLVVVLVAILSYTQISSQRTILEAELENRISLMKANLIERGKGTISNLSLQVENNLAANNFSGAVTSIKDAADSSEEIKYAILMDASGIPYIDTHRPELTEEDLKSDRDRESLNQKELAVIPYEEAGETVIEIITPLQISIEPWGVLRLVYTLKLLDREIENSRMQIRAEIRGMVYRSVIMSLLFLLACLIAVFFLSARISNPLIRLTRSARKLAKGDFSVSSDIRIRSRDEVGVLGESFIEMSRDLEGSYTKLEELGSRYRALFEYSPISLWEQDFSEVKAILDDLAAKGNDELKGYFEAHPDALSRCMGMIRTLDVNRATLDLYEADDVESLAHGFEQILGERSSEILADELNALSSGDAFEIQCVNRTMTGREISVLMKASIPPGYETTWSRVLLTVHDLSERMRAEFLKDMFGRYLSEEVTNTLLENPDLVNLGGERRNVTIMISDLRGFTALAERLEPEQVVQLLNTYFEVMVDVLGEYNATINEIVGDSLLVIFGAPQAMEDRAQRAVACAIHMQNAMAGVNAQNRAHGLPGIEMGIGLNDAEVIVGNIGSSKRSKYGLVGSGVNMASRIETYTVGGQILVSESVRKKVGDILRIDGKREVLPKGADAALTIYEVGGIGGPYNLALDEKDPALVTLERPVPLHYKVLGGKHVGEDRFSGSVIRLSGKSAEIELETPLEALTNLEMNLADVPEDLSGKGFYGKVIEKAGGDGRRCVVRFTSAPPEVASYFLAHRQLAEKS